MTGSRPRSSVVPSVMTWGAFAVVVGVMAWVMLAACDISVGGRPVFRFCEAPEDVAATDAAARLDAEQARTAQLNRGVAALERQLAAVEPCARPEPPPAPPPEPVVEPPPEEPQPEPVPEVEPEPEEPEAAVEPPPMPPPPPRPPAPERAPQPEPEPDPNAVTQLEAPPECPVQTPAELLLVMDTSGSMLYKFNAEPGLEQRLIDLAAQANRMQASANNPIAAIAIMARLAQLKEEFDRVERQLRSGPGPDRISVAKEASVRLIDALPPVVDLRLVTFQGCENLGGWGPFSAGQRPELKLRIQGIQPHGGTPLAHALDALPRSTTNGRTGATPVNVVVISDGQDSCDGDPCAAARRLKQQMPFAVVSVVAASRTIGSLRCIADQTKGLFLEARSVNELEVAIQQASGQERPAQCR
ncbi:VWA domain-containing protein [Roseospira marina]|uniref:VWA domain-containing protein n=1 Tax=Roseospira marina TaxID=140057 RepID=A0A5M6I724_9PROT|nr:VWA domain-containing protein [Roseospira marina]KAA5603902.1 VWA domain-containing protein [Roseospira marina]MBB4315963.1 hypothetical protein [Roseospira marina]MBB5089167.1 Mg-chelatase subunit ChlD [Roseospira marina]